MNADHCTNQGTQGTFQSYTTTACQDPVQFLDNPDTTHSELSNRGDHSQQPTGFQPRPAVVEVHAASLPSANAASFSSAFQSAAPEIPTVSVPSFGTLVSHNGMTHSSTCTGMLYPKSNWILLMVIGQSGQTGTVAFSS